MKLPDNRTGTALGLTGALLACLPCCLPLMAPLYAWLGISTLGVAAVGWYAGTAGAVVLGLTAILFIRRRLIARREASSQCGCRGACRVDCSVTRTEESA